MRYHGGLRISEWERSGRRGRERKQREGQSRNFGERGTPPTGAGTVQVGMGGAQQWRKRWGLGSRKHGDYWQRLSGHHSRETPRRTRPRDDPHRGWRLREGWHGGGRRSHHGGMRAKDSEGCGSHEAVLDLAGGTTATWSGTPQGCRQY